MAQTSMTEGQSVVLTNQTVTAGLDGLSMALAVLTECSAIIITARVSTTSFASSISVSVVTSIGPYGPITTVISTSGYVTGHPVKETINKLKVDQADENKISSVASEGNTYQIQEKLKS